MFLAVAIRSIFKVAILFFGAEALCQEHLASLVELDFGTVILIVVTGQEELLHIQQMSDIVEKRHFTQLFLESVNLLLSFETYHVSFVIGKDFT